MTDRYAVSLYEQLFIPKPWVSVRPEPSAVAVVSRGRARAGALRSAESRAGRRSREPRTANREPERYFKV